MREVKGVEEVEEVEALMFCAISEDLTTPLLARRGAEADERSESGEAGWWNSPQTNSQSNP